MSGEQDIHFVTRTGPCQESKAERLLILMRVHANGTRHPVIVQEDNAVPYALICPPEFPESIEDMREHAQVMGQHGVKTELCEFTQVRVVETFP